MGGGTCIGCTGGHRRCPHRLASCTAKQDHLYRLELRRPCGRDCKFGLAKLRLDGFVCAKANDEWGHVTTKRLKLEGDTLELNEDAKAGWIGLELLDENGNILPEISTKKQVVCKRICKKRGSW